MWDQYPYSNQPQYSNQYNRPNNYMNAQTPQFQTNKIYVKGPEEALFRTIVPNCIAVYFDENEHTIYEVRADMEGKKQLRTLYINEVPAVNQSNNLDARVTQLEQMLAKLTQGDVANEQSKQ